MGYYKNEVIQLKIEEALIKELVQLKKNMKKKVEELTHSKAKGDFYRRLWKS